MSSTVNQEIDRLLERLKGEREIAELYQDGKAARLWNSAIIDMLKVQRKAGRAFKQSKAH